MIGALSQKIKVEIRKVNLSSLFLKSKLQLELHAFSKNEPSMNHILIYLALIFATKLHANKLNDILSVNAGLQ